MPVVLNDPIYWPLIDSNIFLSYWIVAAAAVVVYDWVLTIDQEIELIWKQRWSFMTVLYLVIRYIGMPFSLMNFLRIMPLVSLTDTVSNIMTNTLNWISVAVAAMLGAIMTIRLYAMYERSRIMLMFLVIVFLAVNIACGVITAIGLKNDPAVEVILSGTHVCEPVGTDQLLVSIVWILNSVWEFLALCLALWIAVKQFRGLRRLDLSTGSTIGDCFRVLIQSHVLYFASFAGVSCLQLISDLSPAILNSDSIGVRVLIGILQIISVIQMFVLGPRLILSVRQLNAKLVVDSAAETFSMNSIVFQKHVHVSTSSTI
ncbi:uncharacterized protein HD556DRAFT_61169 [Suillus plorans]|uniref:DUF6533 domain-containing protein n=1 Tax=Suillus plorans TaxID=116603 RepID=A0A9P7DP83_9AGAM|nr:uncharacterized protein HD556DRAFT_61169 [Suillus plorans]KAG1799730.1 hypothetical protein HD556DRAFT_61169 [Suillus plorans]